MSYIFKMPKAGEGINEGEIIKWNVAVGDSIEEDATIVEIQNDKLVQEVPSPVKGKITKILVEENTVAEVGDPLAEIDAPGYENEESEPEVKEEVKEEKTEAAESTKEETSSSSNYVFKLPKVGEGIVEGEIMEWKVEVGDTVSADQTILEVQNDKLVQEVPSPVDGVVKKIIVEANTVAQIGDPIAEIEVEGGQPQQEVTAKEEKQESKIEESKSTSTSAKDSKSVVGGRVLAMPSVRQFARDNDVEITNVKGTGKHNHITKEDVEQYISQPQTSAKAETVESEREEVKKAEKKTEVAKRKVAHSDDTTREKMSPTRRAISDAMVTSKAHAAHVTIFDEVEVSKLMDHRKKFKEVAAEQDIKLTYLAYMTKAVVTVLRKYPIFNASVDEDSDEIVYKNFYNVGIAIDTEHGLYVPNIKDADKKGVFTVAEEIADLAKKTHNRELVSEEMSNGSTTISNIGSAWGMWFAPIINYPEVAIFGMGRIEKKPIVLDDGSVGVGNMIYLSLSFDHRVIDGSIAQQAMNELKRLLEDPQLLLMEGW